MKFASPATHRMAKANGWWHTKQVADFLHVPLKSVENLKGLPTPIKVEGCSRWWKPEDIKRFKKEGH